MKIADVRRQALVALIDRRFGGVQARFGTAVGRQADYVSRLVNGKKALGERLARDIETQLGLELGTLDRLPEGDDSVSPATGHALAGINVPVIDWALLGPWLTKRTMDSRAIVDFAPRPAGLPSRTFALHVRGQAMEPEFRDGWLIFVDDETPVKHGDFVVAVPEGRETPILRQLSIDGDTAYLRAVNRQHPDRLLPLGKKGKIIGRVVYQAKPY